MFAIKEMAKSSSCSVILIPRLARNWESVIEMNDSRRGKKFGHLAGIISLLCVGGSVPANAGKLYKWVDDEGQVRYGDQIPPQFAKQRQDTLNPQGVVVDTKSAAKTPDQLAEERREAEIAAEQERQRMERAQHDHMLLSTFTSEDDMVMTRDGKIAAIEAAIHLAEARTSKDPAET